MTKTDDITQIHANQAFMINKGNKVDLNEFKRENAKGVCIAPPTEIGGGQLVSGVDTREPGGGKVKKLRPKIGGKLQAVDSAGTIHYPSQNPDRLGGHIDKDF